MWDINDKDQQLADELNLVLGLPERQPELIDYLMEYPDRKDDIVVHILDRCRETLNETSAMNNLQVALRIQYFGDALSRIHKLNLSQRATNKELQQYYDSVRYQAHNSITDQTFQELRNDRFKKTKRSLHPAQESALWSIAEIMNASEEKVKELQEAIAIDVVIWKMLSAWLSAMSEDDPRASETDLFGANQLQLLKGSSGHFIGRDAIDRKITRACEYYAGAPLEDFTTIYRQTLAEEFFPDIKSPLFWFDNNSYVVLREERRSRKNRTHRTTFKVAFWECDACSTKFESGHRDDALVPWSYRPDSRIKPRKEVTLVDRLPKQAFQESRFMCSCWRKKAGVLCPTVSD